MMQLVILGELFVILLAEILGEVGDDAVGDIGWVILVVEILGGVGEDAG